jgi:glycerol-3-phosphate dehydrogenase (NAD(P)+)
LVTAPRIAGPTPPTFHLMLSIAHPVPRREARVAVLGAGSWGTALGSVLAGSAPTTIWARRPEVADEINARHTNSHYLGSVALDRGLKATACLERAVSSADILVMAVPSYAFRSVLEQAARHVRRFVPIVSLTKGLEGGTRLRMTEIVDELLPGHPVGVLAGPSVARDVLDGRAGAAVIAFGDDRVAEEVRRLFSIAPLQVHKSQDVVGCEIAGAVTNVLAIAAGMAAGLDAGDSTRAVVITRGLAELTRLGTALGGDPETFAGLAGMGDLIATCFAPLSPGRRVGEALARGRGIEQIVGELAHVAEGITTAGTVVDLAAAHGLSMSIAFEVDAVISGTRDSADAFRGLRPRATAGELDRVA